MRVNSPKSVFAWVKLPDGIIPPTIQPKSIVDDSPVGHWRSLGVAIHGEDYKPSFFLQSADVSLYGNPFSHDEWHYIGFTWQPGDPIKIYVDGILDTLTDNINNWDLATGHLFIGKQYENSQYHYWDGVIDEVRIYNRALTEAEIEELYCDGDWCEQQGLVAYYPFNGNADDASGNGNDGDINEGTGSEPTLTTDRFGNANSAFSFDGNGDYITTTSWSNLTTEGLTLSAWINISLIDGTTTIFGDSNGLIDFYLTSNQITFSRHGFEDVADFTVTSSSVWLHVVGTMSNIGASESNTIKLYIDGEFKDTATQTNSVISESTETLDIGKRVNFQDFKGKIDDVRIYNQSLNVSDVYDLYCEGGWCDQ
jgi:hypothetical protein